MRFGVSGRRMTGAFVLLGAVLTSSAAWAQGTGTGLWADYYDDFNFALAPVQQVDATINVPDFANPPTTGLANDDTFVVRWQGLVEGPVTGAVTFYVRTDDGGRVWVDGNLVVDRWRQQGVPGQPGPSGVFNMVLNQRYSIRVEQYENTGGDGAILEWTYTGQSQIVVPMTRLYPEVPPPKISPNGVAGGTNSSVVRLTCEMLGTTIRYTTNGTDLATDGSNGILYAGPFVVSTNTTVKARAFRAGGPAGVTPFSQQSQATFAITDATGPLVTRIQSLTDTELLVTFNEAPNGVDASGVDFTLSGGGTVSAAAVQPNFVSVRLTVAGLTAGNDFLLSVAGITDFAANPIAAGTAIAFTHRPPATASLIDWYRLDEGAATMAADTSGVGTGGGNGTLAPATSLPEWVEGVFGSAVHFDGINDQINIADIQTVVGDTFSLSCWVKTLSRGNTNAPPDVYGIVGRNNAGNSTDIFVGYVDSGGTGGRLAARMGDTLPQIAPLSLNDNAWHQVVITRASGSGRIEIYVDGLLRVGANGETGVKAPGAVNVLGAILGVGSTTIRWQGALDEIRLYNAVVSQNDVYDLFNRAPVVNAGPDQTLTSGLSGNLNGSATDDGLPVGSPLTYTWSQVSGSGTATFASPNSAATGVTFTQGGTYVLRLTVSDGRHASSDEVTVDLPKIVVNPTTLTTIEAGTATSFTIVLTLQPAAGQTVTINLVNGDATEGTLSVAQVVFDDTNWSTPQTVTVTPVDDAVADGNIAYTVTTQAAVSGDPAFSGANPADVGVTNNDNDTPGNIVTPAAGLVTNESGGMATFTIVLTSQPQTGQTVTIGLSSSDTTEGTVSPPSVVFDDTNWSTPQTVTVTGADDLILDFAQGYFIQTAAATSGDPGYSGMNPVDVSVTNLDNEVIPEPDEAWGNCGAVGADALLLLGVLGLIRRGRRRL